MTDDDCTCERGPCPVHCIVCGDAATTTDLDGERSCHACADRLVLAREAWCEVCEAPTVERPCDECGFSSERSA